MTQTTTYGLAKKTGPGRSCRRPCGLAASAPTRATASGTPWTAAPARRNPECPELGSAVPTARSTAPVGNGSQQNNGITKVAHQAQTPIHIDVPPTSANGVHRNTVRELTNTCTQ